MIVGSRSLWPDLLRDGLPFLPKILFFGLLVGAASSSEGLALQGLLVSALGVNAATAQLALLKLPEQTTVWGVMALTVGLNAKLLVFTASIWPHISGDSRSKMYLAGALTTDSSWACCQLAAQRGALDCRYALGISLMFSAVWLAGCICGYFFSAGIHEENFRRFGLDALVPLSIALFIAMGMRGSLAKMHPIVLGAGAGLACWWLFPNQTLALVLGASVSFITTYLFDR